MPNFSGVWTLQEQFEAITEGNWTGITSIELYAWGHGAGGKVGDNTTTANSSPVQIGSDTNWSQTEVASQTTAAVKTDGTLWTWGNNGNGRLGTNTDETVDVSSPVQVGSLTSWSNVAVGAFHMIAVNEARTGMS